VANSKVFEAPKTITELQQGQHPLGIGAREAARAALADFSMILDPLQRQTPPEELVTVMKSKLQVCTL